MHYRKKIGNFGENIAVEYLKRNGYIIIERNHLHDHLEIDIIAKIKEITVFFEVKTRTSGTFGSAEEAIDAYKTNKVIKAVNMYVNYKKLDPDYIRLDFIAVDIDKYKKTAKIKHFKEII